MSVTRATLDTRERALKNLLTLFVLISASIVGLIVFGFIIAAFIKMDAPLSVKAMVALLVALLSAVIALLAHLAVLVNRAVIWQRLSFISHERRRLEPEDMTPAWKILKRDIESENIDKEIEGSLRSRFEGPSVYVVWFMLVALAVWLFARNWQLVETTLASAGA